MNARDWPPGAERTLSAEILALYREARTGSSADFKAWAMARAHELLPIDSTSWVNGVMTEQGLLFHESRTDGMASGYWERFQDFLDIDPLGPRMFAQPGRSFLTGEADMPAPIVEHIMRAFDVRSALSGMASDRTTGTFSVVCWHRGSRSPPFTEADRQLHEQLLPHWVECLNLHRVGTVLRDLESVALPGYVLALVESTGLIHYAQLGFGDLLGEEFPGWPGTSIPGSMIDGLRTGLAGFEGEHIQASWRLTQHKLWMVHVRSRFGRPAGVTREVEARLLSEALVARERQLDAAGAALHEHQKQEAVMQERQRIIRELHDGVGAHLVGLLNLVSRGNVEPALITEAATQALDEMRMAVDALQPMDGNLSTLLGTLRYRLQPRLDAAGIAVDWDMQDLAAVDGLSPKTALQIQRILLEAITNVMRHAGADRVALSVRLVEGPPREVQLCFTDDGIGIPDGAGERLGVGLANMRARAASIGAELSVTRRVNRVPDRRPGTEILLRLRLD